ncbi:Ketoreductase azaE [Hypsizygus marmoreus]|uniref:Ketoreductase azaE n=1 Tax=Hypsizygus marmoreus TaxID=39966 RepID=A0A369JGD9_HYPMA|nr:Ketoreductase azaE [Hypsizygus marmoreus]
MPAVTSGKVLVSGANGFIASWVIRDLLEKGYSVRGTVRSTAKGQHLLDLYKKYGDKFELVIVEDITKEGAFDEAVKGVDAIEHTASPFHYKTEDPKDYIEPAVNGTIGILKSALKNAPTVKRVVVTSSVASFLNFQPGLQHLGESDWNTLSVKELEEKGWDCLGIHKYCASKTLAERAAWDFARENAVPWDTITVSPPFVFGYAIHEVDKPENLNESLSVLYKALVKGTTPEAELTQSGNNWIDVRDLAEAHTRALQKDDAAGHRFIVTAGPHLLQDFINIAHTLDPSPIPKEKFPPAIPEDKLPGPTITYDTTPAQDILGLTYRTKEETTRDFLTDIAKRGWY